MEIILTKGIQNSGKSSWASQFVKEHQDWKRVNRDSFRYMLSDYTFTKENEELVQKLIWVTLDILIKDGYNIILDEMNLGKTGKNNKIMIETLLEKHRHEATITVKTFPITLKEAISRHEKTGKPFGREIIEKTWEKHKEELELLNYFSLK